jgi:beta-glucosidase-like glycosyl hydrolase/CubicO group peptidase (beta-lactamase class C family)
VGPAALLSVESSWVDSVYNELSLKEKIGQLFMVAAYSNKEQDHYQETLKLIRQHHIGGLIFFQGHPDKQAKLTNIYQNYSDVPLMIGMDAEWGLGMRLDSVISYPRQMALGAVEDDSLIYRMGRDLGQQMRRLGVHINFAPVVDVNNNPRNPVIGSRSFGSDRHNVARKGISYMHGMQDECVLAVAKHFPGHGDTDQDSHKVLPVIPHDSTRLDSLELYPFRRLVQNGVGGMMVAHLNVPAYTEDPQRPATLSSSIVDDLLKEQMDFQGLVFTDALNMRGVTDHYEPGEIEAEALKAGNDVLLYPQDVKQAISHIRKQVRQGIIPEERINQSVRKILAFKYWAGMDTLDCSASEKDMDVEPVRRGQLHGDLNRNRYQALRNKLVEKTLTLVSDPLGQVPVARADTLKIASLALGTSAPTPFQHALDRYASVRHFGYQPGDDPEGLMNELKGYDLLLASVHGTHEIPSRRYGMKDEYISWISQMAGLESTILVHFGNPYALRYLPVQDSSLAVINAFNDENITQKKAAQALFGALPITGRLPVDVDENLQAGHGIERQGLKRLSYGLPEEAGMSSHQLSKIDTIIHAAIDSQATPGCQVLVARKGKVVYHKSFGHHTYLGQQPVRPDHLYDLASITKIVATIPSLMRLYEQDTLHLDSTLGHYLPYLDTTNKGDLVVRDVLTHQARLKSWIPFYYKTLEPLYPGVDLMDNEFSEDYPYKIGSHAFMVNNTRYKEGIYNHMRSDSFPVQVSGSLYMKEAYTDSVFRWIDQSELLEEKDYVYSDLGYYYFYRIIEKITNRPLEDHVRENFYKPLGAGHTGFLPLERYGPGHIIPTQNDMVFRRELLRGHVHDPGTAMLGGVCGHAGVFSNALDLGRIMQMYLNGGSYGGTRFFKDSTIELFTRSPYIDVNGNRRALGFDKPVPEKDKPGPTFSGISQTSYGHTGFTGTVVWADPEEEVVYVFLSNRIHPDQHNLKLIRNDYRTRIQKQIYRAIYEP